MRNERGRPTLTIGKKLALSALVCTGAASLVGAGVWASFTATASVDQSLSSGTMSVTLADPADTGSISVPVADLAPGDSVQRTVDVQSAGSIDAGSITLGRSAAVSSLLDTDTVNGLHLQVDSCSVPWTELDAGGGAYTYACGGDETQGLAPAPIIGSDVVGAALASGATDHMRLTVTLPAGAGNDMQGLSSTITYTFTTVQRDGAAR